MTTTRCASFRLLLVMFVCGLGMIFAPLRAADTIHWTNIGIGAGGNMVNSAVCDSDPNIVLMASDVGGFFRSSNGGQSWTMVNQVQVTPSRPGPIGTDHQSGFGFDPTNPSIVYFGALKSTDFGQNWQVFVDDRNVYGAGGVIDPSDHNIVYAYGGPNVYRSSDGWASTSCVTATPSLTSCSPEAPQSTSCAPRTRCYQASCVVPNCDGTTSGSIRSLVIDPSSPTHLIACADLGLYQSTDGAQTWTPMVNKPGLPTNVHCSNLTLHGPTRTLLMAIHTQPTEGPFDILGSIKIDDWQGGLYKSTDWGMNWSSINSSDDANLLPDPSFDDAGGDMSHPAPFWFTDNPTDVSRDPNSPSDPSHTGQYSIKILSVPPMRPAGSRSRM